MNARDNRDDGNAGYVGNAVIVMDDRNTGSFMDARDARKAGEAARSIAVLGSTGSIGRQTIDVARRLGIRICALAAAGNDIGLLTEQICEFKPEIVSVADDGAAKLLMAALRERRIDSAMCTGTGASAGVRADAGIGAGAGIEVLYGEDGLRAAASQSAADTIVAAVSGAAGLPAVISAIKAGRTVALANKETLVMAGRFIMELSRKHSAPIIPVDSEHSAIFQCLRGRDGNDVRRLILTASGGPFRGYSESALMGVTPEQALAHPTWQMGPKVSIDSATLANKGLELIEASWLFGAKPEQIDVLIHPQSIIHSMVEFYDGAVIAQLGEADMRTPIQYALTYPERREGLVKPLDFISKGALTFEKPDCASFPCLRLAYDALREGGTMPAVYNAANEAAVQMFISRSIGFADIPQVIRRAMERHSASDDASLENIFAADREARDFICQTI